MYDGICFVDTHGRVAYSQGCFQNDQLVVDATCHQFDPKVFANAFAVHTTQVLRDMRQHGPQTGSRSCVATDDDHVLALGPACVFRVVAVTFTSICAVATAKSRGLIVERLPFGVLVVAFRSPHTLETVFPLVDAYCAQLRRKKRPLGTSTMYFCAACNAYMDEAKVRDHDVSTAHMLATTKAPTLRKVWLPETNRGYQLMMNMGWSEGAGLGPHSSGRVEPVQTVFKTDRTGIGMERHKPRVTHFPAHDAEQARTAADHKSTAERVQESLARKRKHEMHLLQTCQETRTQRTMRLQREKQREQALHREIYATDMEGYEAYLR
ncbi:TPA: hypothetical protein N0F65_002124 [Lagenidium giganteum]|uniref:G-patch domain-containing protein n=1 Tax=Lagenidium giganteum TaxID=4803 RepID=A0AAV2ZH69_9STRA|nr:TPA: hypothetical protein N0F65_002124 [Lagenidium giganteum]